MHAITSIAVKHRCFGNQKVLWFSWLRWDPRLQQAWEQNTDLASCMTSVGCGPMSRQENKDFVQNHVITHRKNQKATLQKYILSVLILNMSISMGRGSIILVPSFFSFQDASNDTHDHRCNWMDDGSSNGSSMQFDPGHGRGPPYCRGRYHV